MTSISCRNTFPLRSQSALACDGCDARIATVTSAWSTTLSPTRFAFALAAGLAVSYIAAAHDDFPGADWCTNGTVAYTGAFAFTRAELYAEVQRRQQAASTDCIGRPTASAGGPVGHCGIFDPPYEAARSIARAACGASESAAAPA